MVSVWATFVQIWPTSNIWSHCRLISDLVLEGLAVTSPTFWHVSMSIRFSSRPWATTPSATQSSVTTKKWTSPASRSTTIPLRPIVWCSTSKDRLDLELETLNRSVWLKLMVKNLRAIGCGPAVRAIFSEAKIFEHYLSNVILRM